MLESRTNASLIGDTIAWLAALALLAIVFVDAANADDGIGEHVVNWKEALEVGLPSIALLVFVLVVAVANKP